MKGESVGFVEQRGTEKSMGLECTRCGTEIKLSSGVIFLDIKFLFFQFNKFKFVKVVILMHLHLLFLDFDLASPRGDLNFLFEDFCFLLVQLLEVCFLFTVPQFTRIDYF
jgi:hypothetical protein